VSYGDYPRFRGDRLEQLTYLLFLKACPRPDPGMADERSRAPYQQASLIPAQYDWSSLLARDGDELFEHYRHALEALGSEKGTLALIFNKAQNKFQDLAKLRRVIVDLIDKENWSALSADVKGDAYEGLLEKNAQDLKSGAGQYFTPRALIQGMVDCIAPKPGETICDPACGTGGFRHSSRRARAAAFPANMVKTAGAGRHE
jgi:type I restriction enzyme M protein